MLPQARVAANSIGRLQQYRVLAHGVFALQTLIARRHLRVLRLAVAGLAKPQVLCGIEQEQHGPRHCQMPRYRRVGRIGARQEALPCIVVQTQRPAHLRLQPVVGMAGQWLAREYERPWETHCLVVKQDGVVEVALSFGLSQSNELVPTRTEELLLLVLVEGPVERRVGVVEGEAEIPRQGLAE